MNTKVNLIKLVQKLLFIITLTTGISYATTYASPIIKGCSSCYGLIIKKSLTSGNTFGAVRWTDGKMFAPMLPAMLKLVKCPHCNASLWIDEEETLGRTKKEYYIALRDYGAKAYLEPELKDYFKALEQTNISLEKEIYLRLHTWWKGNDQRRNKDENKVSMSEAENVNLIELYELLSIENHSIMMAEIQRELGEYDKAMEILDNSSSDKQSEGETFIRDLIEQRNPHVLEIKFEHN